MGMAMVASSDTSTTYCHRVVNCQNGPEASSVNWNPHCRITNHPRNVRNNEIMACDVLRVRVYWFAGTAGNLGRIVTAEVSE